MLWSKLFEKTKVLKGYAKCPEAISLVNGKAVTRMLVPLCFLGMHRAQLDLGQKANNCCYVSSEGGPKSAGLRPLSAVLIQWAVLLLSVTSRTFMKGPRHCEHMWRAMAGRRNGYSKPSASQHLLP